MRGDPRVNWWRREGIAVDASARNTIAGNTLRRNAFGGIFLYKNCWETHSYEPDSEQRVQHAHSNMFQAPEAERFEQQLCLVESEHRDTVIENNAPACRGDDGRWEACPEHGGKSSGCTHATGSADPGILLIVLWMVARTRGRSA